MAPLVIIYLLLAAARSCSARLPNNGLFIAAANPSIFDLYLNSVACDHIDKGAVQCDQGNSRRIRSLSSSANSVNEITKLSCRLSPTIQNIKKADESPASNEDEGILNLLPKGVPSHVNSIQMNERRLSKSRHSPWFGHMEMTEQRLSKSRHRPAVVHMQMTQQRLSKSSNSPGVGHMQITRNNSQTRNVDINHSNGDDKNKKQNLSSTPSPGAG